MLVGIYRRIESFQGFLGGWISGFCTPTVFKCVAILQNQSSISSILTRKSVFRLEAKGRKVVARRGLDVLHGGRKPWSEGLQRFGSGLVGTQGPKYEGLQFPQRPQATSAKGSLRVRLGVSTWVWDSLGLVSPELCLATWIGSSSRDGCPSKNQQSATGPVGLLCL